MPGFLQISRFLKNLISNSKYSINLQTLSILIKNAGIPSNLSFSEKFNFKFKMFNHNLHRDFHKIRLTFLEEEIKQKV